jgi:hypothetical protein
MVDTILTLTQTVENTKMGCWKFSQPINNKNFDYSLAECSIKIFDMESVKVAVELMQQIEQEVAMANATVTQLHPKKVATAEVVINLNEDSEDKTHNLHTTLEGCVIVLNVKAKPFDEEGMKEWLFKQIQTPENVTEAILWQFYAKIKESFTEYRTTQLKSDAGNKKNMVKAAIMKKLHISDPDPLPMSNNNPYEFGLFYPQLVFGDFVRVWEHLDYKSKIKHYMGFQVYSRPIFQYYKQAKLEFTWHEFLEQNVLLLNYLPILEELSLKYSIPQLNMHLFCISLLKYIPKGH